jgi:hypothetical protein
MTGGKGCPTVDDTLHGGLPAEGVTFCKACCFIPYRRGGISGDLFF